MTLTEVNDRIRSIGVRLLMKGPERWPSEEVATLMQTLAEIIADHTDRADEILSAWERDLLTKEPFNVDTI